MMFYAPTLHGHEWDAQRARFLRARQHQIAMERERERRLRQREYARRLALQRNRERRMEEDLRRQRQKKRHCESRGHPSFGFSDPFFDFGFMRFGHPLKSRAMPCQEAEEEEEEEECQHLHHEEEEEDAFSEVDMQQNYSSDNIHDSDKDTNDEEFIEQQIKREQDTMFAYMTNKIRSMRRRRKSDADFNPDALLNLAESELNWLMDHEAMRCEENAKENHHMSEQEKQEYRKLVLTFLRVYVCENILDTVSRDNFPPKPADDVTENEAEDGSQPYYVLDVERRRKLHRLAARLEKEFE